MAFHEIPTTPMKTQKMKLQKFFWITPKSSATRNSLILMGFKMAYFSWCKLKITGQTQPSAVLQHQKQEGYMPATSYHWLLMESITLGLVGKGPF